MSVMVVGGDYLGTIEKNLYSLGVSELLHLDGRKGSKKGRVHIPQQVACILVFTDYINHNTAKLIKDAAKLQGVPSFFSKRSWGAMEASNIQAELLNLRAKQQAVVRS